MLKQTKRTLLTIVRPHSIPSKISLFPLQKNLFLRYPITSIPRDDYRESHHNIAYVFANLANLMEHYHPKLISVTKNKDIVTKHFFKKIVILCVFILLLELKTMPTIQD